MSTETPQPGRTEMDSPLRERRRRQTAREIESAALELFRAHGFTATTAQDIAAKAGMSPRTFFRYCDTKVDAVPAE